MPRDARFDVTAGSPGCDLAEVAAPVDGRYPVQFVRSRTAEGSGAALQRRGGPADRELNILLGKNIEAGRIMAGVTFSRPGNWTSWPPHEHAGLAEEAYLYIDMPRPRSAFSWSTRTTGPELARSFTKAMSS